MTATLRIGHAYDLHRLEPRPPAGEGRPFILGGVALPELEYGPVGHSDGDALYHAVTDAILGALAHPDIGQLFPDTDPRHAGEDSSAYVIEAARRLAAAGLAITNLDATIIAERPKIAPIKDRMRANIAQHLGVDLGQVNVKGKTHEGVDAVGEGRALEVHVVVLVGHAPERQTM